MDLQPTELNGVLVLQPKIFQDHRGSFVKTYQDALFSERGIRFVPREEFFSVSKKDVLRGMHFQLPPAAHDKLVYCAVGRVLDVVVDLRRGSKTFGKSIARELSAANRQMMFIPVGCAHGFLTLEDNSIMVYQTSTPHAPAQDAGILWNSFGFDWPVKEPVLSDRDRGFPALCDFSSPF